MGNTHADAHEHLGGPFHQIMKFLGAGDYHVLCGDDGLLVCWYGNSEWAICIE